MAKAIGAGFPVAALGGSREVMEQAADGRTMHGGTYNSSPLVCAAVIAACRETGGEGFYEHLNARGARLAEGLVEAAAAAGIEACWSGVGALFQLWFSPQPPNDYREANAIVAGSPFFALYRELRDRGVLIQPPQEGLWLMSGAHTDADIDRTLEAAADAMPAVAAALAEGSVWTDGRTAMRRVTGFLALATATALLAAGCGGGTSASGSGDTGAAVNGGILRAGIPDNPDHLDPALSYANEGWEILEATGDGLLAFKRASGAAGAAIVPDLATRCPRSPTAARPTLHVRPGVMFSAPVCREVQPTDFKFSIERLFRIDSGGVGFYTGIVGADSYAKTRKGGISGIVANDKAMTITFHLTQPDGTFTTTSPSRSRSRPRGHPRQGHLHDPPVASADRPYRITGYAPPVDLDPANPTFQSWTPDTPDGYLDGIDVQIGVTPEQAVNEIADGELDWYFESVPPDRLTELKAKYPEQVYAFVRTTSRTST